ncbi:MAG: restriction endonuclease subunit S [Candidatus Cloacimonadaceae bacterium]|nr:restriction endonuclease subunit S [Candidatus Cloacimonadaceae bacterium]
MGNDHWVLTSLRDATKSKKGKKPSTTCCIDTNGAVPYILIDQMEGNAPDIYTNDKRISLCDKDDVLIVWDGSIGKTAIGLIGAIGSTIVALTPIKVISSFLFYFLNYKKTDILQNSRGSGLQHINQSFFWNVQIPVPFLSEQQQIVEKLDAILPKIRKVKERLEKIPVILKKFRQRILSAACTGKLTEDWREEYNITDAWAKVLSQELFQFVTSGSRGWAKYYSTNGALFIRIGNLDHCTISLDLEKKQFVNPPEGAEGLRTKVIANDILVSITADVGMIGLIPEGFEEAYINQHIALSRPNNRVYPRYLAWYLASSFAQSQLQDLQRGATKVGLGLNDIKSIMVPVPSLQEQHEIARRVDKLFALTDSLEAKYKKAMEHIEKIEQSVLAKAFRGDLVLP